MSNTGSIKDGLTFSPENAQALAVELFSKIRGTGFNALSKNDFYDFVLYLLDRYSSERFLSRDSIQQNALLLRAAPAKIRSSRLNIYLKFLPPTEQREGLEKFINLLTSQNVRINKEGTKVILTLDDPVVRFCLDAELKFALGVTYDILGNNDLVSLEKEDFYAILRHILHKTGLFAPAQMEDLSTSLASLTKEEKAGPVIDFLLDAALETASKVMPLLPIETIRRLCLVLSKTLKKR
jgi:hypothetical protein